MSQLAEKSKRHPHSNRGSNANRSNANSANKAVGLAAALDPNHRFAPPPVILRLLADQGRRKDVIAQDYFDLYSEFARAVAAADIIDHLAVLDLTETTFDILRLRKARVQVVACMRENRREEFAWVASMAARRDRSRAYNDPLNKENPLNSGAADADLAKLAQSSDGAVADGRAFLDALDALERIDAMIEIAGRRRDKALDGIARYRRQLDEPMRAAPDRLIDRRIVP